MKSHLEIFRRLEREVRLASKRLPIDAFLSAPDSLPTQFPDPPPSTLPRQSREVGGTLESDEDRRERRRVRRAKKPAPPTEGQPPVKLEDEIQQFMNRDKREGAHPDEIAEFLGGFDPSEITED
jgi:hypothetical protein